MEILFADFETVDSVLFFFDDEYDSGSGTSASFGSYKRTERVVSLAKEDEEM